MGSSIGAGDEETVTSYRLRRMLLKQGLGAILKEGRHRAPRPEDNSPGIQGNQTQSTAQISLAFSKHCYPLCTQSWDLSQLV